MRDPITERLAAPTKKNNSHTPLSNVCHRRVGDILNAQLVRRNPQHVDSHLPSLDSVDTGLTHVTRKKVTAYNYPWLSSIQLDLQNDKIFCRVERGYFALYIV